MKPFSAPLLESSLSGAPLLFCIVAGCSAGFLLFGYDQGIANALTQSKDWQSRFPSLVGPENSTLLGATLGFFVLGAFFGCITNSIIGNGMSRRALLFLGTIGTFVGAALQTGSINLGMFMFARLANGYFVGILTAAVPPYVAELTKPRWRGLLMSLELVLAATGLMSAFWVTYGFRNETSAIGWRLPIGIQCALILVSLLCLCFSPESPRYLMEIGKVEEGKAVLQRLYGTEFAEASTAEIVAAVELERSVAVQSWSDCFKNNDQSFRYRTFLALGVNFFQQATGINISTYYAGSIFIEGIGLPVDTALLVLGNLGVVGLVFAIAGCFYFVDNVGRVRTLIIGSVLQSVAMIMLAAGLTQRGADGVLEKTASYISAVGLFLFIAAFSGFWLIPSWIYGAEITPLAIRQRSQSLGIATQFLFNFVVVMVTPIGISRIGGYFYIPWAISNAVIAILLFYYFPEPARLSLEQIDALFQDGKVEIRRSPRAPVRNFVGGYPSPVEEKGEVSHIN